MKQSAIEDDLARGIGILDLINAIPDIIDVGVEPRPAFKQVVVASAADKDIVLVAADQMIPAALAIEAVDTIVAGDEVIQLVARAGEIFGPRKSKMLHVRTERETN